MICLLCNLGLKENVHFFSWLDGHISQNMCPRTQKGPSGREGGDTVSGLLPGGTGAHHRGERECRDALRQARCLCPRFCRNNNVCIAHHPVGGHVSRLSFEW